MSRRLGLGFVTLALIGLVVGVFYLAPQLTPLQGGSDCDQDPECEVLPPSDSGGYDAPGPITEFCVKTGQNLICFGQGTNNSGHELAHCWNVVVDGSHVTWSRNEDSSTCQDPSHFQVWWEPSASSTPTNTATQTNEPPTESSTPTATESQEPPTDTPTITHTATGTPSGTASLTPSLTPEGPSATPSSTQVPTETPTPTNTGTGTQPTPTQTPMPSVSPTATETLRPGEPSKTPDPTNTDPPGVNPTNTSVPVGPPVPSSTPQVGTPPPPSGGGFPILPVGILVLACLLGGFLFLGLRKLSQ